MKLARELSYFEYHGHRYEIKDAALADSLAVAIDNYINNHKVELNNVISSSALSTKADKSVTNTLLTRVSANETDIDTLKNSVSAAVDGANTLKQFMDNLEEITFDVDDNGNVYATGDVPHSTGVGSVNGKTGDVLLSNTDVGAYANTAGNTLKARVDSLNNDETISFTNAWFPCCGELFYSSTAAGRKSIEIELPGLTSFDYKTLNLSKVEVGAIRVNGSQYYSDESRLVLRENGVDANGYQIKDLALRQFGITMILYNENGWTELPSTFTGGYVNVALSLTGSIVRKGVSV